ncbi:anti-sigma-I factor RsgI family protein [Paenisporosarcina antarctica]|uniref:RsgI N-terminal anti-sigma domain-containing protein n=1 Tax=Paenisporosarcina antarctica TaxID=417367 RepID=A0A4P6ZZF8_9BACL|nr:hypothetical protein [Paenisporosarcina antarctica]QBP41638.1 hypothetical protein E2636_10990 [Paenisporosarcina antarctica]
MDTQKGIVFETKATYSIFLTSDGLFIKGVPICSSVQVGEEASFRPYNQVKHPRISLKTKWTTPMFAIAATTILLFFILLPSQSTVSAFVQIDINPSIELGIDKNGKVYLFNGLNEDGVALKRNISFWKGKPLSWVMLRIINQSQSIEENEKINITAIYQNEVDQETLGKVIATAVSTSTSQVMTKENVKVINASTSDREIAKIEGISVRQYHDKLEVEKEKKNSKENKQRNSQSKESENVKIKPAHTRNNVNERTAPISEVNQTHNQKGTVKSEKEGNKSKEDIKKPSDKEQSNELKKPNENKVNVQSNQQTKLKKEEIHTNKKIKNDGNKMKSSKINTNKDKKNENRNRNTKKIMR